MAGTHRRVGWSPSRATTSRRPGNPRVEALVATTDGFELAEVDLDLRGEGTLMSTAQKGRSDLKLASLRRDRNLVELARAGGVRDRRRRPRSGRSPGTRRRTRSDLQRPRRGVPRQELTTMGARRRRATRLVTRRTSRRGRSPRRPRRASRGPNGRGSPRTGRRRRRPAPRCRPRGGMVSRWHRPPQSMQVI